MAEDLSLDELKAEYARMTGIEKTLIPMIAENARLTVELQDARRQLKTMAAVIDMLMDRD